MNPAEVFLFDESQYFRIGCLAADRDAFLLLFEIAKSPDSLRLSQLCGRFRTSPSVMKEVLGELADLGMLQRQTGTYKTTQFGRSVIELIQHIAHSFQPTSQVPASATTSLTVAPRNYAVAATDNTVRRTLSTATSVISNDTAPGKDNSSPVATDDNV